jgi:type VI protein secretion system component VasK
MREYRGKDFSVRIQPSSREAVWVIYSHEGTEFKLGGELIGRNWEGISVNIPRELTGEKLTELVKHLEAAFQAMGRGYVISQPAEVETVSETEKQAALDELRMSGYEAELSDDRKQVRLRPIAGAPRQDMETARNLSSRMMPLIQAIRGTRQNFQILAKSKES